MNIYPTIDQFREWTGIYKRVPILGEKKISSFDLSSLFQRLFYKSEEAFLFESRKGPKKHRVIH